MGVDSSCATSANLPTLVVINDKLGIQAEDIAELSQITFGKTNLLSGQGQLTKTKKEGERCWVNIPTIGARSNYLTYTQHRQND